MVFEQQHLNEASSSNIAAAIGSDHQRSATPVSSNAAGSPFLLEDDALLNELFRGMTDIAAINSNGESALNFMNPSPKMMDTSGLPDLSHIGSDLVIPPPVEEAKDSNETISYTSANDENQKAIETASSWLMDPMPPQRAQAQTPNRQLHTKTSPKLRISTQNLLSRTTSSGSSSSGGSGVYRVSRKGPRSAPIKPRMNINTQLTSSASGTFSPNLANIYDEVALSASTMTQLNSFGVSPNMAGLGFGTGMSLNTPPNSLASQASSSTLPNLCGSDASFMLSPLTTAGLPSANAATASTTPGQYTNMPAASTMSPGCINLMNGLTLYSPISPLPSNVLSGTRTSSPPSTPSFHAMKPTPFVSSPTMNTHKDLVSQQEIEQMVLVASSHPNQTRSKRDLAILCLILDLGLSAGCVVQLTFASIPSILNMISVAAQSGQDPTVCYERSMEQQPTGIGMEAGSPFDGHFVSVNAGGRIKNMGCHPMTAWAIYHWALELVQTFSWPITPPQPMFMGQEEASPCPLFVNSNPSYNQETGRRELKRISVKRDAVSKVFQGIKKRSGSCKGSVDRVVFDGVFDQMRSKILGIWNGSGHRGSPKIPMM